MKNKYIALFSLGILFIIGCKNGNVTYKVSGIKCKSDKIPKTTASAIKSIKIYLETSASMKGYINKPSINDSGYTIKKIVPYLITDLDSKIGTPELYTISSSPTRYKKSKEEFINSLFNGKLINGGSTYIHKILKQIIDDNNYKNGISFLISDCILDIGDNNGEKDRVGSAIYSLLNAKKISALLFQYYSEFNGNWYYDQNSSERPFLSHGITMHKRPFYIWVFGSPQNLSYLLKRHILKNYDHSFIYGFKITQTPDLTLVQNTGEGKIYISNNNNFTLIDYTQGETANFAIGINLSKFPGFIQNISYLRNNLQLDNSYLKKKIGYTVYRKSSYIKNKLSKFSHPDKIANELSKFTHVIEISISNLNPVSDTTFSLSLIKREPIWIKQANIMDDLNKTAKQLEGKTYAFNIITDAFRDKFLKGNNCIFKLNFKKIK